MIQVLKWEDVEIGDPKDGEIRVRNKAIGLNFIDVYFRKGVYKAAALPFIPGLILSHLLLYNDVKFWEIYASLYVFERISI